MQNFPTETNGEESCFKDWNEMDLEHNVIQSHLELEAELAAVAELIKPLPPEIRPSQEFVERTRLQLLQLPNETKSSSRKAA